MAYTALTSKVAGDVFTEAMWTNLKDNFDAMRGNGSASAPSITFDSDANTGLYRIAEDRLGFTTAGTKALEVAADGKLLFGNATDTNLYRSAADVLKTDDSFEAANVKANGISLPRGVLGKQTLTTDFTTSATHTTFQDSGFSLSITYEANRILRITCTSNYYTPGGVQGLLMRFVYGSTPTVIGLMEMSSQVMNSGVGTSFTHVVHVAPGAAATATFKTQVAAKTNNTQVSQYGDSTYARFFMVEDVGAA